MSSPAAFAWFAPTLSVSDDAVTLAAQGCFVIFRYLAGRGSGRPHIATLCGPSGRNMLEDGPVDHLHQHGVWWGHGDVNGVDYYLELPEPSGGDGPRDQGRIEHVAWRSIIDDAPHFGFVEELEWRDHRGDLVLCESRSVLVNLVDGDHYTVDVDSASTAAVAVTFGGTKEAALPGIRVAEALTAAGGATMRNSRGQTGELETFGQEAEWLDISGSRCLLYLGRPSVEGIACFGHPANPGHPNRWFTRGYGPVSPFPGHHFSDERTLEPAAVLRLRHRLVIHRGDADEAGLEDQYRRYCSAAAAP